MPDDGGCSADTSDMKAGALQMTFILDYTIDDFGDVTTFIKVSIHIIDRDGCGEALAMYILQPNILNVNKSAGAPQVNEHQGVSSHSVDL